MPTSQLVARPHSHLSNRAKARSALERKPVFKSLLENPFQISWPSVPPNVQNVVLACLVTALENIPSRRHTSRTSLQKRGTSEQGNVDITEEIAYGNAQTEPPQAGQTGAEDRGALLVIGINAVTKALESQLGFVRKRVVVDNRSPHDNDQQLPHSAPSSIAAVFVCHADIDPSVLVDHIPYLVAGCNSPGNVAQPIKLVPLPQGSEPTISQILGVRRAAVIAFRHGSHKLFEAVQGTLDPVPIISAPWLCPSDAQLVPTHVKQLRTTAPKDMKGAREQRSKARAEARKDATSSRAVRRKPRITLTTG